ncbi:MAG: bifunctional diaminohydroxyphosphoribosylaminopyrimidine deaminase/5-amino-6-(5-phosphoribosylamino)uracil reductase RibD [Geobacteraceae bacterium]|nr:bifunctional diaminohydroxyphosphoribosylaminopyrimidine deaminase/5-amino-6-(5-phosphoribosylamino)uracil reductase RibD [Geobacteraceae bacterium]
MIDFHNKMMKRALALARRGLGRTSPNPAVGCVIVLNGEIVGEGWHRKAGTPHAEVHALCQAGDRARGADVYVTLEPCSHHGRTPPCAEALIKGGVARVFVGMSDPNPLVSGQGLAMLRGAAIAVECGVLEAECRLLNEAFVKHITSGLPFVIVKSALTLDGKTATANGDSKWITCEESRRYVHTLRSRVDAIMVGVGTVLADDPQLTCRMVRGKDPRRIVVDSRLRTPLTAALFHLDSQAKTIVATVETGPGKVEAIQRLGAETLLCDELDGRVDLEDLLRRLGASGIQSILLEGGRELVGSAVRKGLVDKFMLFYAPKILAGEDGYGFCSGQAVERMGQAFRLRDTSVRHLAEDFLVIGYPER